MVRIETISYPSEFANTYFLIEGDQVVIIDPGSDGSSLVARIEKAVWKPLAILLTHGHFDHINGVEYLQKRYDVPAYIHEDDVAMLDNARLNGADMFHFDGQYDIKATPIISDQTLVIGNLAFETIHTPFHTQGSVCYYIKEAQCLFSGDTLFKGSIGRSDLPTGSFRHIAASLAKLQSLPPEVRIYPGHGPKSTIGSELQFNRYFKKR
jgi:glyoxylase-like metal-dependent hydrolase (beta-lactamase superfamily II)